MTAPDLKARLQAQLDAITYQQLALALAAQQQASRQAGYLQALNDRARSLKAVDTLRGLLKSWTAWTSAALLALPEVLPMLQADLPGLLGPDAAARVMQVCGVLMLLLRLKTTAALADKARSPAEEKP